MFLSLLTAFTLGLMTIIDPCTLFTSVAAVGYIDKEVNDKKRVITYGVMFVVGKVIAFMLLSVPLLLGAKISAIEHLLEHYGEPLMAFFMIASGVFMLFAGHLHHNHDHGVISKIEKHDGKSGALWAMLLGMFFSIAFCPHRLIYFLTMIDLALSVAPTVSWLYPLIFSLGTGLPILLIAIIVAYSATGIARLTNSLHTFEKWFRYVCALLFIGVGVYLAIHCLGHDHHEHDQEHANATAVFFNSCSEGYSRSLSLHAYVPF